MHRSIGKRIRMDEPPPPEYDTTNPMSPEEDNDGQEPYSLYESYSTQRNLPTDSGHDSYTHERTQSVEDLASQQYETHSQYNTIPQGNQVSNYDTNSQSEYVPPLPPYEGRITRSYLKNAGNPQAQAAWRRPLPEEKPRRGRPRKNPEPMGVDACLYGIIKRGQVTLPTTVDEWIESYKLDRESALLELMQFFISAAGCKGKITQDMADNMEHAAIIRKMTEEFDEESGEYPLIMSGLQWKKFRSNFCDFISHLVSQCQYAIIYDQYLMDNVISLLTGLSDSQVRAFRHTATLAAMKLMSALVDVAIDVSVNLENTKRQYESERQKARDKRASDRLEHLISKRQELEENTDEIKNMLTYLFKAVFVHRYRDTLPEIRAICITELGIWMKKFHQFFLDDSYLKYIGWTLHDKVGEVRLKCLQSLQPLYSEELKGKLELFTSKFKDRIVEMTLDKEYEVAVEAIRLVISILKNHRDILTDRDCEHVYELVYSSNRSIAQAAGEFLNERLFVVEDVYVQRTRRGKIRLPNTPLIRDLVQFFIESELHEHGAYLVDSLIESNTMMKDWECMTDLLLEEPGPEEEPLDDRQETSLIELMVCCIKQTSLGEPPIGRGLTRKIPSVKEIKQVQDDKQKLTEHFIGVLPLLLDKYSADPEKLTNLLNIPQHFNLEIYTTSRQEANLDLTLKKIHHITEKHHDTEVLETCAKTLEMLCSEDFPIYMRCDVQRSTLIDAIVNKYKEIMDDWNSLIESEEIPDEDENYNVINSLKKVSIFYSCHNLGTWNIWSSLMKDVEEARMGNSCLPEEAIKYCISSCFYALLWDLHHIEELVEGGARVDDTIAECRGRLTSLMEGMKQILLGQHSQVHKEESYLAICDLLVVFSNQLYSNSQAALSGLVYEPDNDLISILNNFVQINVFNYEEIDEQSKIAELHKRRNFLASYCKLIVYSIVPTTCASDVFKHYLKSYNDYGDIIKTTIGKARDINKVNCARTMATALTSCFRELMMKPFDRRLYRAQDDFANLKELAKRFALTFGLDPIKNREGVTALHRDGILFAVADHKGDPTGPPPNLPFLEVLTEFTNRLLRQDRRVVLNYLDRRITIGMPSSRGEDWQALVLYRNSLIHGEADHPPVTAKRAYTRRRNFVDYGVGDEGTSDSDFMPGF